MLLEQERCLKEEALLLESKMLDEEAARLTEKAEWVQVLRLLALLALKYKYRRKGRVEWAQVLSLLVLLVL